MGVGRDATVEVVRQLAALDTGAAICHASGFAETGEAGAALQAELVAAAAGMPIVGPNCYGTLSAPTGAALWPDVHGLPRTDRGVALLSQSGNIAVSLTMQRRCLDIAWVMTLGNQADVGVSEAFETMAAEEAVTGIGLCIEGLDDTERFVAAAASARRRGLPVVALKLGASETSGAVAVTHTASLVGDDAAYDALFRRLGIRRVHTLPELLDTLAVLCALGPLRGPRLVSLSCSGGEAALVADRSRSLGLSFPPFAPDRRRPGGVHPRRPGRSHQPARLPHVHLGRRGPSSRLFRRRPWSGCPGSHPSALRRSAAGDRFPRGGARPVALVAHPQGVRRSLLRQQHSRRGGRLAG